MINKEAVCKFNKILHRLTISLPVVPLTYVEETSVSEPESNDAAGAVPEITFRPTGCCFFPDVDEALSGADAAAEDSAISNATSVPATFVASEKADAAPATRTEAAAVAVPVAEAPTSGADAAAEVNAPSKKKAGADDKARSKAKTASISIPAISCYQGYHNCLESFKKVRWNIDVHRKVSHGAGKGIFCLRPIVANTCVALYSGHLVDNNGVTVVRCPTTAALFERLPSVAQRSYSRGHCVAVKSVACPHVLVVDGIYIIRICCLNCILYNVLCRQSPCLLSL